MKKLLLSILSIFIIINGYYAQSKLDNNQTKTNTIILKINENYKSICNQKSIDNVELSKFFEKINTTKIEKKYPNHQSPKTKYDKYGNKLVDLSLIYEIQYDESKADSKKVFKYLNSLDIIEYAEPYYIPKLLYDPTDPNITSQWYLNTLHVYDAWDICKGDSNIIIGITDTGTDFARDDIANNIFYNYNDPIDSIDNDNDGFINNFRGWDTGENDNNPQWNDNNIPGKNAHGVAVSSVACSKTDNNLDMAGIGFRTKFLPVKISNEEGSLTGSYEGLVYAADHGCNIINCSWGGSFGSYYGQDIVNYATFNKNSLVIAAAGNSHINTEFFPASYENVLSVGGTNSIDYKWTPNDGTPDHGSNYGYHIDVDAPGVNIHCAYYDVNDNPNFANSGNGTSLSSPMIAGCAAIVLAHYDTLKALQIGEVLRVTADNIDTIPFNAPYAGLLGSGRVNLFRAVSDTLPPSIRFNNISYNNSNPANFHENDTIYIRGRYTNYLTRSNNCMATITSMTSGVQILQNTNTIGQLSTMDTINNYSNPFIIKLLPGIDYDKRVILKITYTDTDYSAFEYFEFLVNSSILTIDTNNIATSLTSVGKFAYESYYPINGIGFLYKHQYDICYEAGLMISAGGTNVSDCVRGSDEFEIQNRVEQVIPATISDFDAITTFNDNGNTSPIGIEITQNTFAWDDSLSKDFIIVKYDIINNNSYSLDSFYVGLFADWDIIDYSANTIGFNQSNKISYTNSGEGTNLYAGIQLLSAGPINHYAIDNVSGGEGGVDISDGYSTAEKLITLSTNRHNAGQNGNDVCDVLSSGPHSINAGDTLSVCFALHSNIHLTNLLNSAVIAQAIYDSLYSVGINKYSIENNIKIYPNPTSGIFTVEANNLSYIELIDNTGRIIRIIPVKHESTEIDLSNMPKGLYYIKLNVLDQTVIRKIVLE